MKADLCVPISSINNQVRYVFFVTLTFLTHGSNLTHSSITLEAAGFSDSCDAEDPWFGF